MTVSMNQLSTGMGLRIDGEIYVVTEYKHVKPGKGSAFVRAKLKNIRTDLVKDLTLRSADRLEDVQLTEKKLEYMYQSGDSFHFMDHTTYEEMAISKDILGEDVIGFLKDHGEVICTCHKNKVIKAALPIFITASISSTEPGFKGDTSKAGTKPAKIETGATLQVPLFVNIGDEIKIDTRSGQYVERIQK